MKRVWMLGLLLLPACATARGGSEEVAGRDATVDDALRCAMVSVGGMGYRLTTSPLPGEMREGSFRAERWLSTQEAGVRSLGVLSVFVRQDGVGATRLRVDANRFEETLAGGSGSGVGLGTPVGTGIGGRPGPASVDSLFRGGTAGRHSGMKRVNPGPVASDAARVRAECSAARGEILRDG